MRYKVAVCLENSFEPYYFTEKFVDAVRAGCIPVYHAHPSVARQFLNKAVWVDPADHAFDVEATLAAALAMDRKEVACTNQAWARSQALASTSSEQVFTRIAQILQDPLLHEQKSSPTQVQRK